MGLLNNRYKHEGMNDDQMNEGCTAVLIVIAMAVILTLMSSIVATDTNY